MSPTFSTSGNYQRVGQDNQYFYVVGNNSLSILDRFTTSGIGYVTISGGFTDVWTAVNSNLVYLTSSTSGILKIYKEDFKKNFNLLGFVQPFEFNSNLPSKNIYCIDAVNEDTFAVGTSSGISYFINSSFRHSSDYKPVEVVHTVEDGVYYGGSFGLVFKRNSSLIGSWGSPTYILNTFSTPSIPNNKVLDIQSKVVGTDRYLSIATLSGSCLLMENQNNIRQSSVEYYL